jgi:hypothetical protein
MIFAEAEKMNVKIEGNPNEYCFCAEEDDYILDESIKMYFSLFVLLSDIHYTYSLDSFIHSFILKFIHSF